MENLSEHKSGTSIEKYFSSDGLYKVISIGSYGLNNEYIDQGIRAVKNKTTESKLVRSGQLTMVLNDKTANGNLIGRCLLISTDNEFIVNQRTEIIIPGPDLNGNYAYYYLNGPFRSKVKRIAQGGTQIYVNYSSVKKQKINYPIKDEQIKISKLLKIIKKLITLYERKLKLLSQAKKYFLDNLFAEKEYPNLRFKEFTDAWEQRKLGKVATFINGRAYKQNELLDSGKYKVLRVGNFYTNDSWYYSNLELADKYYIDKGDLVYTWSATFGPHIWNGEKVIYHYHIWKIELSKFLDRYFTLQILEADKAKLLANTNGSTMIHVTKKGMESKVISLPTIEEQKQIGLYLTEFDTLIALYENKKQNLIEIKKSLLNTMFI